jgi:hypothetical protein
LISTERAAPVLKKCEVVGKLLRALIRSLQSKGRPWQDAEKRAADVILSEAKDLCI